MAKDPIDPPWRTFQPGVAYVRLDVAMGLIRYTRHFGDCHVEQRTSEQCSCGLAEALAAGFPDEIAASQRLAAMGDEGVRA